jgi:hypothetical protein
MIIRLIANPSPTQRPLVEWFENVSRCLLVDYNSGVFNRDRYGVFAMLRGGDLQSPPLVGSNGGHRLDRVANKITEDPAIGFRAP